MKQSSDKVNNVLMERRNKIAEKIKIDLYQRHSIKFKELNYSPQSLDKDILNFIINKKIDEKFNNYNIILMKVERFILDNLNVSNLNKSKPLLDSKQYNLSQPKLATIDVESYSNSNLNKSTLVEQVKNELINDDMKKSLDLSKSIPRTKLELMHLRQNDEWSRISKLNQQDYIEEMNEIKNKKLNVRQEYKDMLIKQISYDKEKKAKQKEEEERTILKLNRESTMKMDNREEEEKEEIKKKLKQIDEFRAKTIIGILLIF